MFSPPKYAEIGNVWQINELDGTIVLRTFDFLILINSQKNEIIEASEAFRFSAIVNNQLFLQDKNTLLTLDVKTSQFRPVISLEKISNESLLSLFPGSSGASIVLLTKEGSFFEVSLISGKIRRLQKITPSGSGQLLTTAIQSSSGEIYTGTLSNKLSAWKLKSNGLQKIRTFTELQDETVLNLFEAKEGTIWVLLNKGLDYFDPNTPLTNIMRGPSVYDTKIFNNQLFIATNRGVFHSAKINTDSVIYQNEFSKIPLLDGQTWSLDIIDNQLFCGHDMGLFRLKKNKAIKVPGFQGVWKLFPVSEKKDLFFVCTYDGLGLLRASNNIYSVIETSLPGFDESTRDLIDIPGKPDSYWVCHGYKGVFRIKTNEDHTRVISTEHFNDKDGLPSSYNINVHRWNNQNIFTTNNGLFIFDDKNRKFVPHKELNNLLGTEKNIRQLIQAGDTTWCIIDDQPGFFTSDMTEVITNPFLALKGTLNRGLECIMPLKNSNEVFLGTTNGLFAFHPDAGSQLNSNQIKTLITNITYTYKDTLKKLSVSNISQSPKLPKNVHNLNFKVSAPFIRDKSNIRFSYQLSNQMSNWSEWQEKPDITFSLLKSGNYTLKVKAQSLSGEKAKTATIKFSIASAWYASPFWQVVWVIIFSVLIFFAIRQMKIIIGKEKEKTRLEEQKLQKLRDIERENQLIHQEKERIEADIIEKSKDLANNAVLIARKRELLIEIQEKLNELRKKAKNDPTRIGILNIVRSIEINLNDEQQYQLFDTNLERIHQEFFNDLKNRYSGITSKDLRMCAFIKMELTNKEMASIFNISVRGVETARYRLRKKYPDIDDLLGPEEKSIE